MDKVASISVFVSFFVLGIVMIPDPGGWWLITSSTVGILLSLTPARNLIVTKSGLVRPTRPTDDLGAYLILGQTLLHSAPSSDDDEFHAKVVLWTKAVDEHIDRNHGQAEVALFRDSSGMTSMLFNPMRDGIHPNDDRYKNYLNFRMQRLRELIERLS